MQKYLVMHLEGEDVTLINLGGEIDLVPKDVVIVKIPPISEGGSRACDMDRIQKSIPKNLTE